LIQYCTAAFRDNPTGVAEEGYWFQYVEDIGSAYHLFFPFGWKTKLTMN
jgi:hypothetical protein